MCGFLWLSENNLTKKLKNEKHEPTSTAPVTDDDSTNEEGLLCQNTAIPGQDIFLSIKQSV